MCRARNLPADHPPTRKIGSVAYVHPTLVAAVKPIRAAAVGLAGTSLAVTPRTFATRGHTRATTAGRANTASHAITRTPAHLPATWPRAVPVARCVGSDREHSPALSGRLLGRFPDQQLRQQAVWRTFPRLVADLPRGRSRIDPETSEEQPNSSCRRRRPFKPRPRPVGAHTARQRPNPRREAGHVIERAHAATLAGFRAIQQLTPPAQPASRPVPGRHARPPVPLLTRARDGRIGVYCCSSRGTGR